MSRLTNVRVTEPAPPAILSAIIALLFALFIFSSFAVAESSLSVYYFYSADCSHCKEVTVVIEELEVEHPELVANKLEIAYNTTNSELFNEFIKAYNPPAVDIPAVFIGNEAIIGYDLTKERLEQEISFCLQNACPDPISFIREEKGPKSPLLAMLIGTALVEGLNPCGVAVLIVLLVSLLVVKTKRSVLIVGLSFIASVFVTHVIVGVGIIEFYLLSSVAPYIRTVILVIVILAGIINILDFWRAKPTLAIPLFLKPTLGYLARRASIPSAVLLGFLATVAGLPCTGPLYLTMLDLIADLPSKTVLYLLLYNLFYILPLTLILAFVYKGTSPEDAEEWRKGTRKYMKLIGGAVMLAIGLALLFGVI